MKFKQINNYNLGIISFITAILILIVDLFYRLLHYKNLSENFINYVSLALILLLLNFLGILLGIIVLLKSKDNKKRSSAKSGIMANLLVILCRFLLIPMLTFLWL